MPEPSSSPSPMSAFAVLLWRGVCRRCPRCGQGKLFNGYLKLAEGCPACGEKWGHIRADDGPAWLTILVVGHVLGTLLLAVVPESTWPDWALMLTLPLLALVLALWTLPRAKGLFVNVLWHLGQR